MTHRRRSWLEKLNDDKGLPKVVEITEKMSKKWGIGTCVVPSPREVDEIMKRVPHGKLTTINEIRSALAKKHGATIGCPITTGMFASIAAQASAEEREKGNQGATPYWRTLKSGGVINEKYPGGVEEQRRLLESEGHRVNQKGGRTVVLEFEKNLVKL